ncbi:hypothetical protein PH5382_01882 [Phaeobacter sp. CECT 5382]|uniref:hypothetical protein n=1 Tax=Rhodobacterales TaxID=204455 RepID=UPI0006DA9AB5|nr:hypothetical protein [Phaeobacter sp. CECT 5382]CUH87953.1 hypothetical protein PH5382_01882 [Phaeobacter sp. CECT 5382]
MSANQNLNAALGALESKLETLKTLTDANQFMVEALKEQGEALQAMAAGPARKMLRDQARAKFSPDGGSTPNPAVLAILEKSLGSGQSAQIIAFPAAGGA